MKTAELEALEFLFSREVDNALNPKACGFPYQSRRKVFRELEAEGLVRKVSVKYGAPPLVMVIEGWELTTAGHLLYCMSCEDDGDPA